MIKQIEFPKLNLNFNVRSTFELGNPDNPFSISIYGIIIAVGLLIAMFYAFKRFKSFGVNSDKAIDVIIGGILGGIVGARLYYVLFTWSEYKVSFESPAKFWETFSRIFKTWEGGMAIYGGLIGALLVAIIIMKIKKMKILPMLDVVGLGFLIGQGIGRWGNFVNVEAYGNNTNLPWGMTGPSIVSDLRSQVSSLADIGVTIDPTMPVHPCFLYESLWCILGFVLLHLYSKHRRFDGEIFIMYLGWYGLGRFFIEGLRTDSLMIGNLRVSQLLAILLFIGAIITLVVVYSNIRRNNDASYLPLYALTPEGIEEIKPLPSSKIRKAAKLLEKENLTQTEVNKEIDEEVKNVEVKDEESESIIDDEQNKSL